MNSQEKLIQQVLEEHPEPTVALNPLTGFHIDDMRQIAAKAALQGMRQPLILGKHLASHARKLVDIRANKANYKPAVRDRRFQDEVWQDSAFYQRLMQRYFALNESLEEWVDDLDLNTVDKLRAEFLLRIVGDSIAPTNTWLGNPQALRKARQTRGKSVLKGLKNLLGDVRNNHGIPAQVKSDNFELGKNLATTPGAVVFKNEVLELIQYQPATEQVHRRPLLFVPAMVNKYYVLDLSPDRSMLKFAVDSGLQVFMVSWRNPGIEQSTWGVEKYALALMEAITAVKTITRSKDLNLYTLCSGAMMTLAMASAMKGRGDNSIHSMTIGVCMLDLQRTDMEMTALAGPQVYEKVKKRSRKAGILNGHELATSMLWLRPQDLIWGNVVNNYLLGNEPPEFDLLFWNNDWTNLPAQLHCDVIDMFHKGTLTSAGALSIDGAPVDLANLDCDKYIVGGTSDHITPWKACYRGVHVYGGNTEFVLSNSGHMQTLLNSPTKKRASFFLNKDLPVAADEWLKGAELEQGSWWLHWRDWLSERSLGKKSAPRKLGNKVYPAGVAAPGEYVYEQSE
ncbi:MAG: alpha/beta hydrolase [Pseudomonadales bacterium]